MATARPRRRGTALIWVVVTLPVLLGFCSLAVDWGHVLVVRSELRHAADTAARYAAPALPDGIAAVRARARDAADDNTADGTPVVLADGDVEQGNWSSSGKTFTPNLAPLNAVRVTARRSGASAVPLMSARALGKSTFDVEASAVVAYAGGTSPYGFVGLDGITFHNNTFVGSYNAGAIPTPLEGYSTNKANMASNGVIRSMNNTIVKGDITLGPAGSTVSIQPSGTTTKLASPIAVPADPAWSPGVNPLNLPLDYTTGSAVTLPGGTYWFTSLTLGGSLSFSGPATVYVNGNVTVAVGSAAAITAHQSVPSNLKIHQPGDNRTFTANNNFTLVGQISAPRTTFVANNMFNLYGNALFRSIELKNNALIFLDELSMSTGGAAGLSVSLVK